MVAADLESELSRLIEASDLHPKTLVAHGVSTYAEIPRVAEEAGAELIVVVSDRPIMKNYRHECVTGHAPRLLPGGPRVTAPGGPLRCSWAVVGTGF